MKLKNKNFPVLEIERELSTEAVLSCVFIFLDRFQYIMNDDRPHFFYPKKVPDTFPLPFFSHHNLTIKGS